MKILLFSASFPPPFFGGSVEYVFNIIANLPAHSVVVHTGNLYPDEARKLDEFFPQKVIRSSFIAHVQKGLKFKESVLLRKLASLRQYLLWPIVGYWLILRERPDLVHLGEHNFAGIAAWLAKRFLGIPYVFYTYAEEIPLLSKRALHNKIFLKILRGADKVITVSEYTRELLLKAGVEPIRIVKILPAVSAKKRFVPVPEQVEAIRAKYSLANNKVLLTVGALEERKGHATVIAALTEIIKSYPDTKYVIAGTGPRTIELEQLAVKDGLGDRVIFAGTIDDVTLSCFYEICDLFVMPHRQVSNTLDTEGCPTVFLEASSHGKPVIGGNAGGVTDAILDGRTGYIIDGTSPAAVAERVCFLFNHPELIRQIGKQGYEYTASLTPGKNAAMVWQFSQQMINIK
ncbi:MAG: glycosyltransferase family 4 protein [bacterium]|nr:glycosyltransferase family 4 protein [bacterium]